MAKMTKSEHYRAATDLLIELDGEKEPGDQKAIEASRTKALRAQAHATLATVDKVNVL
jgi:hypothetical protein